MAYGGDKIAVAYGGDKIAVAYRGDKIAVQGGERRVVMAEREIYKNCSGIWRR